MIFMDPTMLGFFFVGGIVLLERSDKTLSALFTSPITPAGYMMAKVLSLSFLATLAAQVIAFLAVGTAYRPLLLALGVALSAAVFTLIGLAAVTRFHTVSAYLMGSVVYMLPFALPLLSFFGLVTTPWMYLLPSQGTIVLTAASFSSPPPEAAPLLFSFISLGLWLAAGVIWATRWFRIYTLPKIGEL
jgi:fluoroquinolone transport system permease protein